MLLLLATSTVMAYSPVNTASSVPVNIFAGPGGHLDPEGNAFVARGTVLQITILPDKGYHCVMFTVNGHSFLPQPYISVIANQSTTVSAFFEED